jgi:catechol 2,3-dioxygenase-like lactoylglutathione lyase family enzyme
MQNRLPPAIPQIPVSDVAAAADYYVRALGLRLDWHSQESGIAGISQGDCRIFLAGPDFRAGTGSSAPVMVWINLDGREAVDALYRSWHDAGAQTLGEPEDKPWNLHEFQTVDPDGNRIRVFYDFSWETKGRPS